MGGVCLSACASGCTVAGEHLAECGGVDGEGRPCRGCRPRPAAVGVLCPRCWGWLQSTVRTLPALVDHLFEVAAPSVSSPSGGSGAGRVVAGPRCLYPEALGVADDLVAVLASWCGQVAEALGVRAPRPPGLWVTDAWAAADPVTGEVWSSDAEVVGVRDPGAAGVLVSWVSPLLEECAGLPWVADMLADLGPAASRASARWPVEEPDRRVTTVRCPGCGCLSLVVRPPRVAGAEEQVVCCLPACGRVLLPEEWARVRGWAVEVALAETGGEGSA